MSFDLPQPAVRGISRSNLTQQFKLQRVSTQDAEKMADEIIQSRQKAHEAEQLEHQEWQKERAAKKPIIDEWVGQVIDQADFDAGQVELAPQESKESRLKPKKWIPAFNRQFQRLLARLK